MSKFIWLYVNMCCSYCLDKHIASAFRFKGFSTPTPFTPFLLNIPNRQFTQTRIIDTTFSHYTGGKWCHNVCDYLGSPWFFPLLRYDAHNYLLFVKVLKGKRLQSKIFGVGTRSWNEKWYVWVNFRWLIPLSMEFLTNSCVRHRLKVLMQEGSPTRGWVPCFSFSCKGWLREQCFLLVPLWMEVGKKRVPTINGNLLGVTLKHAWKFQFESWKVSLTSTQPM